MSSRSSSAASSRSGSPVGGVAAASGSGSDRSRSPSSSRSRSGSPVSRSSSSASSARSKSPALSNKSKSPVSTASSRSNSPQERKASPMSSRSPSRSPSRSSLSVASSRSPSPEPQKTKLKVKIKNRTPKKKNERDSDDKDEDEEEAVPRGKGRKPRGAVKGKKSTLKGTEKKVPGEEGEVSSGEGSDAKEFDDGLDENLIGDEEDRARLEKMTEKEREEELFKRAENRENLRKRFEIQKKLKQQQKLRGELKKSESEGEHVDDDDDFDYAQMLDAKERSQDRRKNMESQKFDKKSSALIELKARKQERERKEQERKERQQAEKEPGDDLDSAKPSKQRKSRRDSSTSSSDMSFTRQRSRSLSKSSKSSKSSSEAEDSDDSDTERFKKAPKVQKYVETQMDLEPIRLSRFKMERFIHLPFFKRLVTGCFVRIGIGQHEGRSVYRCTEIVDVCETAKIYYLGKARTNIGLKLRFGKQERVFRLEFISNSSLTPSEFEKWKSTCQESNISLPTKDFVQSKSEEVKKAMSYEFSSADIDAIIEKKEKFNKFPVNYAMTKAKLLKEKEIATAEHDLEKVAEIDLKIQDLEQRAEELDRRRTENTRISSISLINNRNRKNNVMKAEIAIQEEIKRKQNEGTESNPFTRRKCNPRMVTKTAKPPAMTNAEFMQHLAVQQEKLEKENQAMLVAPVDITAPTNKRKPDEEQEGKETKKTKTQNDSANGSKEDLFDAHNFDIEIDVGSDIVNTPGGSSVSTTMGANASKPVVPKDTGPTKRSLNLSDYKKKRGLI